LPDAARRPRVVTEPRCGRHSGDVAAGLIQRFAKSDARTNPVFNTAARAASSGRGAENSANRAIDAAIDGIGMTPKM